VAETLVVHGHRELIRSFKEMDKQEAKGLREELRSAGQVVQREAMSLFAPVSPRSATGYKVRVRQSGVAVEQSLRRTTGEHPEFGALQMQRALLPAMDRREHEVINRLESLLHRVAAREGF
jgi:hypothetical protein